MVSERPVEWHVTHHRWNAWVFVPAAFVLAVTASTWLGSVVVDDGLGADADADWTVPLVALIGIALIPLLIGGAVALGDSASERRRARAAVDSAIAVWPQYATESQWRKRVTALERTETAGRDATWWGVGVATLAIGGIAVWAALAGQLLLLFPLAGTWLVVVGLLATRRWTHRRRILRDRARRDRIAPVPRAWVSPGAIYDEDIGLTDLSRIVSASVIAAADVAARRKQLRAEARRTGVVDDLTATDDRLATAGWSLLELTLDSRKVRTWGHRVMWLLTPSEASHYRVQAARHVRVPPGSESEADAALEAIRRRWSI
jgi:hypothetical protein